MLSGTPGRGGQGGSAVTATIDREVRKLDEKVLAWGNEKVLSTTTLRVGSATQAFVLEVRPRNENTASQKARKNPKIFLHWDMEGTSGLYTRGQAWYWEPGVTPAVLEEGRNLLIADVNSAARAALDAGCHKVIVCDTHHGGGNIRLDKMLADPRVTYLERSVGVQDGKRRWMPGLDKTVDGLMLMAHHAKAGTKGAFLPHAWSLDWANFTINGMSVGEIGIEACYAGHWDIPLVLVQGDEAGCREAEQQFPGVVTAAVKRADSPDRSSGLDAEAARALTVRKIAEAIAKLPNGTFKPFKPALPMTVAIRMRTPEAAQTAARRPGVRRVDEYTVEARVDQQCDIVKWITGNSPNMPEPAKR